MPWSVLQSASADENSGASLSSLAAAYASSLSSGTVLVCAVTVYSMTTATVSDGNGNSFSKLAAAGTGFETSLWALATPGGDVGTKPTITATFSSTAGTWAGILIQEVSGIQAVLDGTAGVAGYVGTGPTGPPSYASSVSGEYLVNIFGDDGYDVTASTTGGYTLDANSVQGATDIIIAYKSSTGGTEAGQWSWGGVNDHNAIILAAFPLAGGTGHTATAALTVTPSFSAARTRGKHRTGGLTVTPSFSAARTRGKYRTGSLIVVPSFSAARTMAHVRHGSLIVIPGFSATASGGESPATAKPQGSWYQLLDIREQARQEFDAYAERPPSACPNDGEPLSSAPASEAASGCELFCRFDGWQYPRDWVRPERL